MSCLVSDRFEGVETNGLVGNSGLFRLYLQSFEVSISKFMIQLDRDCALRKTLNPGPKIAPEGLCLQLIHWKLLCRNYVCRIVTNQPKASWIGLTSAVYVSSVGILKLKASGTYLLFALLVKCCLQMGQMWVMGYCHWDEWHFLFLVKCLCQCYSSIFLLIFWRTRFK